MLLVNKNLLDPVVVEGPRYKSLNYELIVNSVVASEKNKFEYVSDVKLE